jgi:hypothetical protein
MFEQLAPAIEGLVVKLGRNVAVGSSEPATELWPGPSYTPSGDATSEAGEGACASRYACYSSGEPSGRKAGRYPVFTERAVWPVRCFWSR